MKYPEMIEKLASCGLTEKEAALYFELLLTGPAKASDLGRKTRISRMDVYNNLKKLQHHGLVEATLEKPMRFIPIPLEEGMRKLISAKESEIDRIRNSQAILQGFIAKHGERVETEENRMRIFQERKNIHLQVRSMVEEAKRTIEIVVPSVELRRYDIAGITDILRARARAGVQVRLLTAINDADLGVVQDLMEELEIRHCDEIGHTMVLTDDHQVLHGVGVDPIANSSGKDDISLWLNSSEFITAQAQAFEHHWADGVDPLLRDRELREGGLIRPMRIDLGEGSMFAKLRQVLRERSEGLDGITLEDFGIQSIQLLNLIGQRIGTEIAATFDAEQGIDDLQELADELGLGTIEVVEGEDGPSISVTSGSPPCAREGGAGETLCALDSGILQGIANARTGGSYMIKDIECVSAHTGECSFQVQLIGEVPLKQGVIEG